VPLFDYPNAGGRHRCAREWAMSCHPCHKIDKGVCAHALVSAAPACLCAWPCLTPEPSWRFQLSNYYVLMFVYLATLLPAWHMYSAHERTCGMDLSPFCLSTLRCWFEQLWCVHEANWRCRASAHEWVEFVVVVRIQGGGTASLYRAARKSFSASKPFLNVAST
jgi:hypothetical protein